MPNVGMSGLHQFSYGADRVVARLRIAGAIRQEHAIGFEIEHLRRGRLRRHDGDVATAIGQQSQNVPLHAEVVGDDAKRVASWASDNLRPTASCRRAIDARLDTSLPTRDPAPLRPGNARAAAIAAASSIASGPPTMQPDSAPFVRISRVSRRVSISAIATTRSAARYCASVICCRQLLDEQRQIADHQTRRPDAIRFDVLGVGAGVADVRIRQRDDLPGVGRIGENFLIAGHRGVEHHFTNGLPVDAYRGAAKHTAVFERQ